MTTTTENPIVPTPAYRQLRRSHDDRYVAGLAGGLGRYFGVDPVLFRILFVALALCGGSGIALYLVGWLAVADDSHDHAFIDRFTSKLRRRSR